jgi:hypothetical protein
MKRITLQDGLLLVGIASIVGGFGCWSRPLAWIVLGLFCLLFVWLIERGSKPASNEKVEKGS